MLLIKVLRKAFLWLAPYNNSTDPANQPFFYRQGKYEA